MRASSASAVRGSRSRPPAPSISMIPPTPISPVTGTTTWASSSTISPVVIARSNVACSEVRYDARAHVSGDPDAARQVRTSLRKDEHMRPPAPAHRSTPAGRRAGLLRGGGCSRHRRWQSDQPTWVPGPLQRLPRPQARGKCARADRPFDALGELCRGRVGLDEELEGSEPQTAFAQFGFAVVGENDDGDVHCGCVAAEAFQHFEAVEPRACEGRDR